MAVRSEHQNHFHNLISKLLSLSNLWISILKEKSQNEADVHWGQSKISSYQFKFPFYPILNYQGLSRSQGQIKVRIDRMEDTRPQSPTIPGPQRQRPSLSSGMKRSQAFLTTSSRRGGWPRRTRANSKTWSLSFRANWGRPPPGVPGPPEAPVSTPTGAPPPELFSRRLQAEDSCSIRRRIS